MKTIISANPHRFCLPSGLKLLLFSGLLLVPGPLRAATRTVTSLADSGAGSLRDTIAAAGSGDTIQFGVNGTINTLTQLLIQKNLTITNANASTLVIQRSTAAGTPKFGVFRVVGLGGPVGSSRVDLQACKLEYSIVSPK